MTRIYRATTPTHTFVFPEGITPGNFQKLRLTYAQGGETLVEKTEEDVTCDENTLSVTLTEEETARFRVRAPQPTVQIRILDPDGHAFASQMMPLAVAEVLNDEVLGA